ncbi:C-5 cytosine methyltransferase [Penicillium herquei]|nr:C-5 cytosine methyltransferase [Penicillium herquei]
MPPYIIDLTSDDDDDDDDDDDEVSYWRTERSTAPQPDQGAAVCISPIDDLLEDSDIEILDASMNEPSHQRSSSSSFDSFDVSRMWSPVEDSKGTTSSCVSSPDLGLCPAFPVDLTDDGNQSSLDDNDDDHDRLIDLTIDQLSVRLDSVCPIVPLEEHSSGTVTPRHGQEIPDIPTVIDEDSVSIGQSVELNDGSFLYIEEVMFRGGYTSYMGRYLKRTTMLTDPSGIPQIRGELVWLVHMSDPVPFSEIRQFRPIRFSNSRPRQWLDHGDLICRLKFTIRDRNQIRNPRSNQTVPQCDQEFAVEYLTWEEVTATSHPARKAKELRESWRGRNQTIPFGADERTRRLSPLVIDIDNPSPQVIDLEDVRNRTYTFGDSYCGAGGASCGARQAGFALTWAVDKDKHAVETYRTNFPESLVEHSEFSDFMTNNHEDLRVDVCHTSPPCQPFSPAHTISNEERDEMNSSCIFTSRDLIMSARPRVLTMEETFGLQGRHRGTLHRIIMDFIEVGYSIRWGVLDCVNYGIPQMRRRLIIIGAGPGEQLPRLPIPTHGPWGSFLQPFATINSTISEIPPGALDHDVEGLSERSRGGQANYHPSGKRSFTVREAACLQTFPMDFQLCGRSRRKQVGNAVPPRFAEAIFREVRRSLRETDEKDLVAEKHVMAVD